MEGEPDETKAVGAKVIEPDAPKAKPGPAKGDIEGRAGVQPVQKTAIPGPPAPAQPAPEPEAPKIIRSIYAPPVAEPAKGDVTKRSGVHPLQKPAYASQAPTPKHTPAPAPPVPESKKGGIPSREEIAELLDMEEYTKELKEKSLARRFQSKSLPHDQAPVSEPAKDIAVERSVELNLRDAGDPAAVKDITIERSAEPPSQEPYIPVSKSAPSDGSVSNYEPLPADVPELISEPTPTDEPTQSDDLPNNLLEINASEPSRGKVPPIVIRGLIGEVASKGQDSEDSDFRSSESEDYEDSEEDDLLTKVLMTEELMAEELLAKELLAEEALAENKRQIWPFIIIGLAILILAAGIFGIYFRNSYAAREVILGEQRAQAVVTLNDSIALIQEADVVVVGLDKLIDAQVSRDTLPDLQNLLDQVDVTQQNLDSAIQKAESAKENLGGDKQKDVAQYVIDSANYRKQMLVLSVELSEADIAAMQSAEQLEIAWNNIIEAGTNMQKAATLLVDAKAGQGTQSLELDNSAKDDLNKASDALLLASGYFPTADFSTITAYIDARAQSLELAIAADQALIAGDQATVEAKNQEFLTKDAEAVNLSLEIPEDPMELIAAAHETLTSGWREDYKNLWEKTAETDDYLRAWVSNQSAGNN